MRSFRDEYQREMNQVGTFRPDVEQMSHEIHHHKLKNIQRRRMIVSVASAAAVFLLVGGVATAMNYGGSLIQVGDNGFSITGDNGGNTESSREDEAGKSPMLTRERTAEAPGETDAECVVYEMGCREFDSLKAFEEESGMTVPLPDLRLLDGEIAEENIHILGNQVYICIQNSQEKIFSLMQMDHRGEEAYAASSAYAGEADNERSYTTSQGYTYKVIDIMEGGEISSIECAISLYGRDLLVGFHGYTQEEAYAVLQSMDLGVYTVCE